MGGGRLIGKDRARFPGDRRTELAGADRLLELLGGTHARVIELVAPAGFGKSALALALGEAAGEFAVVEQTGEHLLRALEQHGDRKFTAILDRSDHIPASEIAAIASAIELAPPQSRIVLCARRKTALHEGLTVAPNERLTLTARDLALRAHEVEAAFEGIDVDPERLADIVEFSEGWPMVVLAMRRSIGALSATELENPLDSSFDPLENYLMREVVDSLDKDECEALWLCSALPGLRRTQIVRILSNPSAAFRLVDLQLAGYDRFGGIVTRPVLKRLMHGRYRDELTAAAIRAGNVLRDAGDSLYAAAAYLAANALPAACEVLKQFGATPKELLAFPYHAIAQTTRYALEGSTLKACPELWVALFTERLFQDTPDALIHDARDIATMLGPSSGPMRNVVLGLGACVAMHIGRDEVAEALLNDTTPPESPESDDSLVLTSVRAMKDAQHGDPAGASALWLSVRPKFWGYEAWCALMMLVQLKSARATTEPEGALAIAERMCEAAEKAGSPILLGYAYAVSAFTAWIFAQDERFRAYAARLNRSIRKSRSKHLSALADMLAGRYENLSGYPLYFGWAKLVRAASATHAAATQLVYECIEIAGFCNDAALALMSRFALMRLQPDRRAELLEECKAVHAQSAASDPGLPRYAGFLQRFNGASEAQASGARALFVDVARGRVSSNSHDLSLSLKSLELVMALAVETGPVARDVLFERLWPGQTCDTARSALKMCVHRARQQLGDADAVVVHRGTYALGEQVASNAAQLLAREPEAQERQAIFEQVSSGRPSHFTAWEWFQPFEDRLVSMATKIGLLLATEAFQRGDVSGALRYASVLTNLDPCDESATELAIRAHLQLGERGLAVSRYRRLLQSLKNELDVEPSESVRNLLAAGPAG